MTRPRMPLPQLAAAVSMTVAFSLAILKLWGGWLTHTMTLWSLMVDSALDLLASGMNYYFIRKSYHPPNATFPYGYGKAQSVAALSQAYIIAFSSLVLGYQSVLQVIAPRPLNRLDWGMAILAISWTATCGLMIFLRWVAHKTGSLAVRADSFHYETDLLTNLGGIISLGLVRYLGWRISDGIFGLVIVGYMLFGALRIARQSIEDLLDRTLSPEENQRIMEIIHNFHPAIRNPHDFRSRRSGHRIFIEFHIEVDRSYTFEEAHELAEDLIDRIREEFPNAELTVHVDPEGATR